VKGGGREARGQAPVCPAGAPLIPTEGEAGWQVLESEEEEVAERADHPAVPPSTRGEGWRDRLSLLLPQTPGIGGRSQEPVEVAG
jgi:hypothetical protein